MVRTFEYSNTPLDELLKLAESTSNELALQIHEFAMALGSDAFDDGYEEGYKKGFDDGHEEGYAEGFEDGEAERS